jgi:hypothetical protein
VAKESAEEERERKLREERARQQQAVAARAEAQDQRIRDTLRLSEANQTTRRQYLMDKQAQAQHRLQQQRQK